MSSVGESCGRGWSIGRLARRLLGERSFRRAAAAYVRLFGDYDVIAGVIENWIPPGAHVLDVGGGDGGPQNFLLRRRPDIDVTLIDIAPRVGDGLEPSVQNRVVLMPDTTLAQYCKMRSERIGAVLILDVLHHVPRAARTAFLTELKVLLQRENMPVIIKDVEPDGSIRARLNYLADRYISNDREVTPIGAEELTGLLSKCLGPGISVELTDLYEREPPHYALVITGGSGTRLD